MNEIIETLITIQEDDTVPRNVREKIKSTIAILENKGDKLRVEKCIEELGDVADDANVPSYAKMQIWSIVSQLETIK